MKKNKFNRCILAVLLCTTIVSCNQKQESKETEEIPIGSAYENPEPLNAANYFETISYIPLETSDESLIGNNPTIWVSGDKIIVLSDQNQCLTFDKKIGKFIGSIGHIGNDPEGSQSFSGWLNNASSCLYFPAGDGRNVIYDTNGNFKGTQNDPDLTNGFYGVDNYDYLDSDRLVMHLPATDEKPDRIYIYSDTAVLASYPSKGELINMVSGKMENIINMNVFKIPDTEREVISISYKDGLQNSLIPSEQIFWHVGDDLFFRELFNDTIYQVEQEGLIPAKSFNFGSKQWKREDRYNPKKDNAIYPLEVFENDDVLWLRFIVNLHNENDLKMYNAIYDKKNKTTKVAPYGEGVADNIYGFIPLQPVFVSPTGEFVQLVSAENIKNRFEEHPGQTGYPAEIENLRNLTEEDNPVVILFE